MRDPHELADPGRVLLWDLDGTIADTQQDIATGVLEMLRELGRPPLGLPQVIRHVGHGVRTLVAGCLAAAGNAAIDEAEVEHGVERFRAHYWRHLMDATAPYPGMPEILHALAAGGRRMAVVSNKPEDATREILRRLGLLDCFQVAFGGDSLPVRKPDPAPLLRALALCRAGATPDQAVMIGDSAPDAEAARAAGIPVCGVGWGFDPGGELRRLELDWWFETVEALGSVVLARPGRS